MPTTFPVNCSPACANRASTKARATRRLLGRIAGPAHRALPSEESGGRSRVGWPGASLTAGPFPLDTPKALATMRCVTMPPEPLPALRASSAETSLLFPLLVTPRPVPCPCGERGSTRKESRMRHPPSLPTFTPPGRPVWPALETQRAHRWACGPPWCTASRSCCHASRPITPSCAPPPAGAAGAPAAVAACPSRASRSCWPWGSTLAWRRRSRWVAPVRWWTPSRQPTRTLPRAGVRRAEALTRLCSQRAARRR